MGISSFFESRVSVFVSNVDGHCRSYHYEQVNVNWGTRLLSHWQFWNRNGNMKLHKRRWRNCVTKIDGDLGCESGTSKSGS